MIVAGADDLASFRARARRLLADGARPEDVVWEDRTQPSLFGDVGLGRGEGGDETVPAGAAGPRVPAPFVEAAGVACDHADPQRFDVLYRLLWKLTHGTPEVLHDPLDPDAARLASMVRQVREEEHRMHAFVRFRRLETATGEEHWLAWFRPAHPVLRRVAPFFARRYPAMKWTIFTPDQSADWDGQELRFGAGAPRDLEPRPDELDALFLTYYESIFNPARTNVSLFRHHVPARIEAGLPERAIVKRLPREAASRVHTMKVAPVSASEELLPATRTLESLRHAASTCRACPIGERATQTVFGEGKRTARLMIVGEQPGDEEDLEGRPFVGPAGRLLDELLGRARLVREDVYVTNAVKHFKWEPRGKRRLHSKPNAPEVLACRGWLLAEVAALAPSMILCLGATAAQSFCGPKFRVTRDRGKPSSTPWAPWWMATYHPSALLRAPDAAARRSMEAELLTDLERARSHLATLGRDE